MYKDYEWYLKHDLSKFAGKWIAIHNSSVVESDQDLLKLHQKLQKRRLLDALITKVSNNYRIL